jgi:hypothetical protein
MATNPPSLTTQQVFKFQNPITNIPSSKKPEKTRTQNTHTHIYIYIWDCKENSTKNKLKLTIVLVPARIRYGYNLMSITHKASGYITFTMKVVAMTLSPLTSLTLKQHDNHNTLNYTILLFWTTHNKKTNKTNFSTL